ncbi:uncharacterized protein LACBIDRAFT_300900 [Laccaria bicolor S238N-H82]|uniref:Predicted protein n=1 Tax=Laccaria bicolor (strain S238N-H82 / ATCC MYA-4686) TaxID=486041 RepID=B0CQU5_LACBS|nr:uncharacterized protein LACBIDRAFT_300900 [Laccaria bicolor S238N-H82]EDR15699.1 predicted protein [Laccaria bicolor S238N-H82]|eukprot:XP_001873907.1 predicted protein [Laccaria bicolor S238N-H82]
MASPLKPHPTNRSALDDAKAMPPPPAPVRQALIMEPEINGLADSLQNAVVKTGQMYRFYADARKLGITKYASSPPRSLTASLGREIEKYDQLCDSLEAHLLRAIAVLQRDLRKEKQSVESAKEPPRDADVSRQTSLKIKEEATIANIQASPPAPSSSSLSGRRPSAISISSLQRPAFSLKLDLSATSLRISAEEAAMFSSSGLASPVTLAPKSARAMGPTEFPPELMAAFSGPSTVAADVSGRPVDIDLTIPDPLEHSNIGDSSDKPIELDLDGMDIDMPIMTDLFGDADGGGSDHVATPADGLFSPVLGDENSDEHSTAPNQHEGLINQLVDDNASSGVFATPAQENMAISQLHIPSPGALLASFSSSATNDAPPSKLPHAGSEADPTFDLNSMELEFFSHPTDSEMNFSMDMGDFLAIQGDVEEKSDAYLSSKG